MDIKAIKFGWQRSLGDPRDRKFAFKAPAGDLNTMPQELDWWQKIAAPAPYNQGQTGSCVGQTGARGHHMRQIIKGDLSPFKPSALYIYANARMERGGVAALAHDDGCQIRDALKSLIVDGVCPESYWPFSESAVSYQPVASAYEAAEKAEVLAYRSVDNTSLYDLLSALNVGPVMGGISVFTSFMDSKSGDVPMPQDNDSMEGGHALTWTGYSIPQRRLTFDNSWGSWGAKGRGTIPFDYILDPDLASDFWLLTDIE